MSNKEVVFHSWYNIDFRLWNNWAELVCSWRMSLLSLCWVSVSAFGFRSLPSKSPIYGFFINVPTQSMCIYLSIFYIHFGYSVIPGYVIRTTVETEKVPGIRCPTEQTTIQVTKMLFSGRWVWLCLVYFSSLGLNILCVLFCVFLSICFHNDSGSASLNIKRESHPSFSLWKYHWELPLCISAG